MTQEEGAGEWHPQTETNWSREASCLASLNRTHSAWFLWPRWADQLQLAAWSFGSPRLCLLISKCIIADQICILFQCAEYFQMSYKILCWKSPRTDFSRNSQGADSLFITPNYPFTVSLTFLITDSLMIVLFLPTTDAEIHWSGLKLNPSFKPGTQSEVFFPLKLEHAWKSPGRLVKIRLLGLTPRVSDSVGLVWGPEICISNKFPGDAAASLETILWGPLFSANWLFC